MTRPNPIGIISMFYARPFGRGHFDTFARMKQSGCDFVELLVPEPGELDLSETRRVLADHGLGVVLAAPGYPLNPRKGDAITGIPAHTGDCAVFHAGTSLQGDTLVTSGGRVLCVTALADSVRQAQQKAYQVIKGIQFDGMQYRSDIGFRAIKP
jgi:phosphoribosylamine-glycine ligase